MRLIPHFLLGLGTLTVIQSVAKAEDQLVKYEIVGDNPGLRNPLDESYYLAFCRIFNETIAFEDQCGQPAADEFCKAKGHGSAHLFDEAPYIGMWEGVQTKMIAQMDRRPCSNAACGGFERIVCNQQSQQDASSLTSAPSTISSTTNVVPSSSSSENLVEEGEYGITYKKEYVDWCFDRDPITEDPARCGKPVADALCKLSGRGAAISFKKAEDIGQYSGVVTRMVGNNEIECTHPDPCDGITELECSDSVEPGAASSTMEPVTESPESSLYTDASSSTSASSTISSTTNVVPSSTSSDSVEPEAASSTMEPVTESPESSLYTDASSSTSAPSTISSTTNVVPSSTSSDSVEPEAASSTMEPVTESPESSLYTDASSSTSAPSTISSTTNVVPSSTSSDSVEPEAASSTMEPVTESPESSLYTDASSSTSAPSTISSTTNVVPSSTSSDSVEPEAASSTMEPVTESPESSLYTDASSSTSDPSTISSTTNVVPSSTSSDSVEPEAASSTMEPVTESPESSLYTDASSSTSAPSTISSTTNVVPSSTSSDSVEPEAASSTMEPVTESPESSLYTDASSSTSAPSTISSTTNVVPSSTSSDSVEPEAASSTMEPVTESPESSLYTDASSSTSAPSTISSTTNVVPSSTSSDSVEPEAASSTMEPVTESPESSLYTDASSSTSAPSTISSTTNVVPSSTSSDSVEPEAASSTMEPVTESPESSLYTDASSSTSAPSTISSTTNVVPSSTSSENLMKEGEYGITYKKEYVDWCFDRDPITEDPARCGKPVADALCKLSGRGAAISFKKAEDIGQYSGVVTRMVGNNEIECTHPDPCDGITELECSDSVEPEPESTTAVSTGPETCFHVYENQQATGTIGLLQATARPNQATCEQACRELSGCKAYSFWPETTDCYLREHFDSMAASSSANSGIMIDCDGEKYKNFKEVCIEQYPGFHSPEFNIHVVKDVPDQEMCLQKCNLHRNCFAISYTTRKGMGNLCRLRTRLSEAMVPQDRTTSTLLTDCSSRTQMSFHIKEGRTYALDILRIIHGIERKQDCEMICGLDKKCLSLIFYQSDQTCVLRKSYPSLISTDQLATTTSAIRLPNKYEYFFGRRIKKGAKIFDQLEGMIHVGQCSAACSERGSQCSFFSYSKSELQCSLGSAIKVLKEKDTAPSEDFIIGLTRQKEVCSRFPGKRSGTRGRGLLRIVNHLTSEEDCSARCLELSKCRAYTYFGRGTCWIYRRLDKSSLVDHDDAVASVEYGNCHKSSEETSFEWVNGGLDGNLVRAFWSPSNEECRRVCLGESLCHLYTFYPQTGSCIFLREVQYVEQIENNAAIITGIRLTGDYEAYKWRKFSEDFIFENFIEAIENVYHVRSCEERCSKTEGCTGYSYQFIKYYCTLLRNVGNDELMENHGNSIAGFRVPNSIDTDGSISGVTDESEDEGEENGKDEEDEETDKDKDKKKKNKDDEGSETDEDKMKKKDNDDERSETDEDKKKKKDKDDEGSETDEDKKKKKDKDDEGSETDEDKKKKKDKDDEGSETDEDKKKKKDKDDEGSETDEDKKKKKDKDDEGSETDEDKKKKKDKDDEGSETDEDKKKKKDKDDKESDNDEDKKKKKDKDDEGSETDEDKKKKKDKDDKESDNDEDKKMKADKDDKGRETDEDGKSDTYEKENKL